jgi:hypothetical protein
MDRERLNSLMDRDGALQYNQSLSLFRRVGFLAIVFLLNRAFLIEAHISPGVAVVRELLGRQV